jgi:hypothetical protein
VVICFVFKALVTTEPVTTGRHCFKQAMSDLLALALTKESDDMSEPKVCRPSVRIIIGRVICQNQRYVI